MINKVAEDLIAVHKTRDPEIIAAGIGIKIEYKPYSVDTKGYLLKFADLKIIVVNSNFSKNVQRIIIAHELGHALLHSEKIQFMADIDFFPTSSKMELEANKFASELLIGSKGDGGDAREYIEGVDMSILKDLIFYKSVKLTRNFIKLKQFYNNIKGE